ncbi:MAG: toprim domain-containing protein [Selenomonadaceae bacterium]|nr:toprim domain-containing protein [Selenomonadaceae bacterium]
MLRDSLDYIHAHPEIYFKQEAKKGGYVCPVCGNGSGEDGTGVKLIKGQSFRYKCFKCDTSGDVINFYAAEHQLDNREAILQVCALYGLEVPKKKFKKIPRTHKHISSNAESVKNQAETEIIANDIIIAANHLRETDYFAKRGISYETAERYNCGYIEQWTHPTKRNANNIFPSPRVIIPTSSESYVARSTDDNKVPKMKAGTTSIFNISVLKSSSQHVVVVEGEFDALSIIEAGNDAIALGSTSNVDKLIDWLREKNIRPHLPLILNLDADEAGQKATDKLADALLNMRIQFYSVILSLKAVRIRMKAL